MENTELQSCQPSWPVSNWHNQRICFSSGSTQETYYVTSTEKIMPRMVAEFTFFPQMSVPYGMIIYAKRQKICLLHTGPLKTDTRMNCTKTHLCLRNVYFLCKNHETEITSSVCKIRKILTIYNTCVTQSMENTGWMEWPIHDHSLLILNTQLPSISEGCLPNPQRFKMVTQTTQNTQNLTHTANPHPLQGLGSSRMAC